MSKFQIKTITNIYRSTEEEMLKMLQGIKVLFIDFFPKF